MTAADPPQASRLIAFFSRTASSRTGARLAEIAHIGLTVLAIGLVIHKLDRIGLPNVISAMPRNPLFYGLFALSYLALPCSEFAIYRRLLPQGTRFPEFLRKRVFNEAVLDYAGEGYLFGRLRQRFPDRSRQIASLIKDVNLLSGVVSNSATVLLLIAMTGTGRLDEIVPADANYRIAMMTSAALVIMVLAAVGLFHRRLIRLAPDAARFVIGMHALRFVAVLLIQIGQWHAVFPDVPLMTWGLFLTVWSVVTRIPFLPNRDILLAGVGLSLSHLIAAPETAVAGMFVTAAVLPLIVHGVVLIATHPRQRSA